MIALAPPLATKAATTLARLHGWLQSQQSREGARANELSPKSPVYRGCPNQRSITCGKHIVALSESRRIPPKLEF